MIKEITNLDLNSLKFDKKLVIIGLSILVVEMIYHILTMEGLFLEGRPIYSTNYIIGSFAILIGISIIFKGLVSDKKLPLKLFNNDNKKVQIQSTFLALFFSLVFVLLFIFDPKSFSHYSLEDNIIEWLSTLFLFGCSWLFLRTSVKYKKKLSKTKINLWIFYFLALTFFVLAMEEISWFQRVLEFKTPENSVFKYNKQFEFNLHNFATNYVENIYYFGSFLVLVFLPFTGFVFKDVLNKFQISIFIPKPFLAIIGTLFCAYNYDMWNIIFTQYAFFSALIILVYYIIFCTNKWEKYFLVFILIVVILTQFSFLYFGKSFDRLWEITEYKEFLIPLTFLIYAIDLNIHVSKNEKISSFLSR